MAVAKAVSIAYVEQELAMVESWAARHTWSILWDPDRLLLVVLLLTAIDVDRYIFEFELDDYRELPPSIELVDPRTGRLGTRRAYPAGGRSYFHGNLVICAPWNRKAY